MCGGTKPSTPPTDVISASTGAPIISSAKGPKKTNSIDGGLGSLIGVAGSVAITASRYL